MDADAGVHAHPPRWHVGTQPAATHPHGDREIPSRFRGDLRRDPVPSQAPRPCPVPASCAAAGRRLGRPSWHLGFSERAQTRRPMKSFRDWCGGPPPQGRQDAEKQGLGRPEPKSMRNRPPARAGTAPAMAREVGRPRVFLHASMRHGIRHREGRPWGWVREPGPGCGAGMDRADPEAVTEDAGSSLGRVGKVPAEGACGCRCVPARGQGEAWRPLTPRCGRCSSQTTGRARPRQPSRTPSPACRPTIPAAPSAARHPSPPPCVGTTPNPWPWP